MKIAVRLYREHTGTVLTITLPESVTENATPELVNSWIAQNYPGFAVWEMIVLPPTIA